MPKQYYRRAILYNRPNFSISAMTQSVIYGIPVTSNRMALLLVNTYSFNLHKHLNTRIQTRYSKATTTSTTESYHTFCIETIHHSSGHVDFVFYRKIDEVCINKHMIWRSKLSVVLEKQCR